MSCVCNSVKLRSLAPANPHHDLSLNRLSLITRTNQVEHLDNMEQTSTDLSHFPAEMIAAIGSHVASKDLLAMRLVCRSFHLALEDAFVDSFVRERTQTFSSSGLAVLLKITKIPRYANAIRHIELIYAPYASSDTMDDRQKALTPALQHIAETGAEITLALTDRISIEDDDNRSVCTSLSDELEWSYTSMASRVLKAVDFAGTPVRGLDFGFANTDDALDEDWWSLNSACKSLSELKSLKLGMADEEEEWGNGQHGGLLAYRIMGDRDSYDLGEVAVVLGAAVDLHELSVSMVRADVYRGSISFSQRLLKTLEIRTSHLKLRKLHLDKQCGHEGIMNFAALFRNTLTHLSLSDVSAVDAGAWPEALKFLALSCPRASQHSQAMVCVSTSLWQATLPLLQVHS